MTTQLRDPRTFRVFQPPSRPDSPGGIHFPKDDAVLADILRGARPGTLEDKDQEHYYPGDVIKGRLPAVSAPVLLARGIIEVVEARGKAGKGEAAGADTEPGGAS